MYDLTTVRDAVRRAVDTMGPDFRYSAGPNTGCFYRRLAVGEVVGNMMDTSKAPVSADDPRTKTGCLVGVTLGILDIPEDLWRNRGESIGFLCRAGGPMEGMFTDEAICYLQRVQRRQDQRCPWGDALAAAEEMVATFELLEVTEDL